MTKKPCIICVAITGSVPTKSDNPAVPITIDEQIESTSNAFKAGASIAHLHVRNDDGTTSSDPLKFKKLKQGLKKALIETIEWYQQNQIFKKDNNDSYVI